MDRLAETAHDTLTRMAEIRERQGLPPLDGSTIQGGPLPIEPDEPAPPQFQIRPPVDISQVPEGPTEYLDEDPDAFEPESPLIPRTTQTPVPEFQQNLPQHSQPALPQPDFAIIGVEGVGYGAEYLGRKVELNASEIARAQTLVRQAISRTLRAELAALRPNRKRRDGAARRSRTGNVAGEVAAPASPSRRSGAGVLPGTASAEVGVHDSPGPQPAPKKRRKRLDGGDR